LDHFKADTQGAASKRIELMRLWLVWQGQSEVIWWAANPCCMLLACL